MTTESTCCVCLESAQSRGGKALTMPGCCGKWFHTECMNDLVRKGHKVCPNCRTSLPEAILANLAIDSTVPPVQFEVQQQHVQQQMPVAVGMEATSGPRRSSLRNALMSIFDVGNNNNANAVPPPIPPQAMRQVSGRSQRVEEPSNANVDNMIEDELFVSENASGVSREALNDQPALASTVPIELSAIPEWEAIGVQTYDELHAVASISIKEESISSDTIEDRKHMDIVCVLDKSGSMSGSKFNYLKQAMRFIQSQLTKEDRLSIVTFSWYSDNIHGLWSMGEERKRQSEGLVNNLSADGSTNILSGMRAGQEILTSRKKKNSVTCMFLLTDGIDDRYLDEKKALAASMKVQGTSLFVFAFGADHNSQHLNEIASAAESSYIYVEDSDQVIDAFAGALGSQQSVAAKNIVLDIAASPGVLIDDVHSGQYVCTLQPGRVAAKVKFSNLFRGEKRDILLKLKVPATSEGVSNSEYPLFSLTATYFTLSATDSSTMVHTAPDENCTLFVSRDGNGSTNTSANRNVAVEAQILRKKVTDVLKRAMDVGDRDDIATARSMLQDCLNEVIASNSFIAENAAVVQLKDDLDTAISSLASRDAYIRGGRSMMTEAFSSSVQQRCNYSKGKKSAYQSASSTNMQEKGKLSKNGIF